MGIPGNHTKNAGPICEDLSSFICITVAAITTNTKGMAPKATPARALTVKDPTTKAANAAGHSASDGHHKKSIHSVPARATADQAAVRRDDFTLLNGRRGILVFGECVPEELRDSRWPESVVIRGDR